MGLHALISYAAFKRVPIAKLREFKSYCATMFCDSGAFSVLQSGARVRFADYIEWVSEHRDLFDVYVNLDVIGDPILTARNQRVMEAEGLEPLPVWHIATDTKYLDAMLERYDYIGFGTGGVAKKYPKEAMRKLRAVQAHIEKRVKTFPKIHGFGVGSLRLIEAFPWFSVDATTYSFANRTHQLIRFDEKRRRMELCRPYDRDRIGFALYFREKYGISATELWRKEQSPLRYAASIAELVRLEQDVQKRVPEFRYYFGVAPNDTLEGFRLAYELLEKNNGDSSSRQDDDGEDREAQARPVQPAAGDAKATRRHLSQHR